MNLLMTLTGPSCAGKSTLESILAKNGFQRSISVTTRAPRAGETNGVEYYFVSYSEFQQMWDKGHLIEHIEFGEHYYGVSQLELDRLFKLGTKVAVVCEPVGAKQIRRYCARHSGIKLHQVFVDNPQAVINERFMRRFGEEFAAAKNNNDPAAEQRVLDAYVKRLAIMHGIEREWVAEAYGTANPLGGINATQDGDAFQYDTLIKEFNDSNTSDIVATLLHVGPTLTHGPKKPLLRVIDSKEPNIGGEGENLLLYLDPVNSDRIKERMGKEVVKNINGSIITTQGALFGVSGNAVRGKRYLHVNDANEIVAALNVTKVGQKIVVSNIYVRRDYRRQGLATQLIEFAKKEHPSLVVDSSLTQLGAMFFGYAESKVIMSMTNRVDSKKVESKMGCST